MKPDSFQLIDTYDRIDELHAIVTGIDDVEWNRYTFRQKNIVGHKDTLTIPLIFDAAKKTRDIKHRNYHLFQDHLDSLSQICFDHGFAGEVKRANLVKLLAGKSIKEHIDKGEFLSKLHRLHIPVITNSQCEFHIEGDIRVLGYGEIWDINNTGKRHSVHNHGGTDRVHLIIDIN